jgi:hypothetical protein
MPPYDGFVGASLAGALIGRTQGPPLPIGEKFPQRRFDFIPHSPEFRQDLLIGAGRTFFFIGILYIR